jgi:hypothetical protein
MSPQRVLVLALLAVLVVSVGGIIATVADGNDGTRPDVIMTVFSLALTGLLGLFVKSPRK